MQLLNVCAGLILMALIMALPVWPALFNPLHWAKPKRISWRDLVTSELGAVTVTYEYPVSGTTPPTQAQMAGQSGIANEVSAQIQFGADSDTVAVVTHNFNLSTVTGTTPNVTQLFPEVNYYVTTQGGTGTVLPILSCTIGANIATLTKTNLANTSCTVNMYIHRPHSLVL